MEGVEDDAQQLKVMRWGKREMKQKKKKSACFANGAVDSEDSRIMEFVVSCVNFASGLVFRDINIVLTELINSDKLFVVD